MSFFFLKEYFSLYWVIFASYLWYILHVTSDNYVIKEVNSERKTSLDIDYNLSLSRYNNKTYRIDDIDWDSNPQSSFNQHDGTPITINAYFKKVSSEI